MCFIFFVKRLLGKHEQIEEYKDLIENDKFINEYKLSNRLTKLNQSDYRSLKSQTNQQVLKQVFLTFKTFFKSLKEFKKNPKKFKGRPKMPSYKDKKGRNTVVYTNQNSKIKNGEIWLSKFNKIEGLRTNATQFQQMRIIHKGYYIIVEIVYNKEIEEKQKRC